MTDRELKKRFKKLGIVLIIVFLAMIVLSVYTLGSTKAELSIYTNAEYTNNLQALGINEEEFKQYLSIFGNLVDEDSNESLQNLNMATNFINTMCPTYEIQTTATGQKCYEANVINEVLKELKGEFITEKFDVAGSNYTYNENEKTYVQNEITSRMPYCTKIENISKNGDEIDVTYQLAFMTDEQIATGQEGDIHTVKASIVRNNDYKYSKYFIKSIQESKN